MNLSVYLVGERINTGGRSVSERLLQRVYDKPEVYWRYAMAGTLGGFCWYDTPAGKNAEKDCWRKIRSVIGEVKVKEFNMLIPAAIAGAWSMNEAHRAADCLVAAVPRPALLIACGTRVAKALWGAGEEGEYPDRLGKIEKISDQLYLTRIPHPSGRNNGIWYAEDVIPRARAEFLAGWAVMTGSLVLT